jgi:hypothetical protein
VVDTDTHSYRPREYDTDDGPWDPISGGASALLGTIGSMTMGIADMPVGIFKAFQAKSKEHAADASTAATDSTATPTSASRTQSQTDLTQSTNAHDLLEAADENTPIASSVTTTSDPGPSGTGSATQQVTSSSTPATSSPNTSQPRGSSLKHALREMGSRSGSRSRSESRNQDDSGSRSCSPSGKKKEFDPSNLNLDAAIGAGKGISRIVGAGLKSPMDFTMGLARGFHNAPKLYGDDTVRTQERVTDFQSGLKAAGRVR